MDTDAPASDDGPATSPRPRWDVDAQYTVPVGPDLAVDGAVAGISAAVRAWRWFAAHVRGWLPRSR